MKDRAGESYVYVVQENPHLNYTDAERFGDVIFATATEYSSMYNSLRNKQLIADLNKTLRDFRPSLDYLLMTGNPITIGYAFHLAWKKCQRQGLPLKILRWDNQASCYQLAEFRDYFKNTL